MTAVPKRLSLKFNLRREPKLQPADILPIFQRWIQEHTVEDMLIDVIDYKHVPQGPGIILVADESDTAYDLGDGEIGLQYIRKRALPDTLEAALWLVFRRALAAAQALEAEAPGDLAFDFSRAKISFLDRRHYPNQPATFAAAQAELARILSDIYAAPVAVRRAYEDPRRLFALRAQAAAEYADGRALHQRLLTSRQIA